MGKPGVQLSPQVVRPGRRVHVSVPAPVIKGLDVGQVVVQLLGIDGELLAQSALSAAKHHLRGFLSVPSTTLEGQYEVLVASQGESLSVSTLVVLSGLTLNRLRTAYRAEEQKKKGRELVGNSNLDGAIEAFASAESFYRKAHWEHLEAETIFEKAETLKKAGRQERYQDAIRTAMLKFGQAGHKSRNSLAFGKAWLHFVKARDLAISLNDERNATIYRNNVGEALVHLRRPQEAHDDLLEALHGAKRIGDKNIEARARYNLAGAYLLQRQFQEAYDELEQAAMLFEEIGDLVTAIDVTNHYLNLKGFLTEDGLQSIPIQIAPHMERTDLGATFRHVSELLLASARERGVTLTMQLPRSISPVLVDPHDLRQVLTNVVMNALEATPAGGTVTITARVEGVEGRAGVTLRVVDTGHGIPIEEMPKVFEPFFTTKPGVPSTGLGLAIARKIVRSHGGSINFESTEGQGTTATIWLPT